MTAPVIRGAIRFILIVAFVVGLAPLVKAQGPAAESGPLGTTTNREEKASLPSPKGPQEGIKVHGHWTIVIRNEDGSVASRNEFENALAPTGRDLLVAALMGRSTLGPWTMNLADSLNGMCSTSFANWSNKFCVFEQGTNLTVDVPTSGPNAGKVVLSGSIKTVLSGDILVANTFITSCSNTVPATSCTFGPPLSITHLTSKILSSPIPVQANQTMDVTVVISFS